MAGVPLKATIKAVVPSAPYDDTAKEMLMQDLDRMGCAGVLKMPWCLKDVKMVQKIVEGVPNLFEGTIWACPTKWTTEQWS